MTPCVIWAVARTGSTALGRALGALNEPFQLQGEAFSSPADIAALCCTRRSIKHLYEECPDASNLALALAATQQGYRHIHLVRCNEVARLVSRDIATQRDAWTPESAAQRFSELCRGQTSLRPLNVPHLVRLRQGAIRRWSLIRPLLGPLLVVRFEDLTSPNARQRHAVLQRLGAFLGLSCATLGTLESSLYIGDQRTREVWGHAANVGELRRALTATGAL
jgi:hypothetical protein